MLRFADALDVDHTRVPADFILNDKNRRAMQDVEDSKRQVLSEVQIDQGVVSLSFYAQNLTNDWFEYSHSFTKKGFDCIKRYMSILDEKMHEKEKEDFNSLLNEGMKKDDERPAFEELIATANISDNLASGIKELSSNPWSSEIDLNDAEKYLKGTLQVYFTCLKYNGLCTIDDKIQSCMATVAALLVILEIKDEYKAIKEVKIDDVICLNNTIDWKGGPSPSILKGKK